MNQIRPAASSVSTKEKRYRSSFPSRRLDGVNYAEVLEVLHDELGRDAALAFDAQLSAEHAERERHRTHVTLPGDSFEALRDRRIAGDGCGFGRRRRILPVDA